MADGMHYVCNKIILIAYDMHALGMGVRRLYRTGVLLVGKCEEAHTARRSCFFERYSEYTDLQSIVEEHDSGVEG